MCGGAGSGKRTLQNNWSMTSWSAVVEKIANVEIIACQVCVCVCVCACACACACVYIVYYDVRLLLVNWTNRYG